MPLGFSAYESTQKLSQAGDLSNHGTKRKKVRRISDSNASPSYYFLIVVLHDFKAT